MNSIQKIYHELSDEHLREILSEVEHGRLHGGIPGTESAFRKVFAQVFHLTRFYSMDSMIKDLYREATLRWLHSISVRND